MRQSGESLRLAGWPSVFPCRYFKSWPETIYLAEVPCIRLFWSLQNIENLRQEQLGWTTAAKLTLIGLAAGLDRPHAGVVTVGFSNWCQVQWQQQLHQTGQSGFQEAAPVPRELLSEIFPPFLPCLIRSGENLQTMYQTCRFIEATLPLYFAWNLPKSVRPASLR